MVMGADDPTNHKILMVLEYVQGGSLFAGTQISPKKRLPELHARKYFRDILQVGREYNNIPVLSLPAIEAADSLVQTIQFCAVIKLVICN